LYPTHHGVAFTISANEAINHFADAVCKCFAASSYENEHCSARKSACAFIEINRDLQHDDVVAFVWCFYLSSRHVINHQ
jgi:hypothetical protein